MKILNRIKYAYYFIRGKSALIEKNRQEALKWFSKASIYNKDDYELYIHKGFSQFLMKDFEESILTYEYALQLIKDSEKLNDNEKDYLRFFILEDIIDALNILKKDEKVKEYEIQMKNLKWNKSKVKKGIVSNFPCTEKKNTA